MNTDEYTVHSHIQKIIPFLDEEIQRDIRTFFEYYKEHKKFGGDGYQFEHISKKYRGSICFNYTINYNPEDAVSFILYTSGLGLGNYLDICYNKEKHMYSLEHYDDGGGPKSISFESSDWNALKEAVEKYFIDIKWEKDI